MMDINVEPDGKALTVTVPPSLHEQRERSLVVFERADGKGIYFGVRGSRDEGFTLSAEQLRRVALRLLRLAEKVEPLVIRSESLIADDAEEAV
jgi:hypothetical protein